MSAETDSDKATALQDFFSSVYTTETNIAFERLSNRLDDNTKNTLILSLLKRISLTG